jgi:hypothetical protein
MENIQNCGSYTQIYLGKEKTVNALEDMGMDELLMGCDDMDLIYLDQDMRL